MDTLVRSCDLINISYCRRGRGHHKKNWNEVIKNDLEFLRLIEDMAQERNIWMSGIKLANHR